jgi:hypothetical protein
VISKKIYTGLLFSALSAGEKSKEPILFANRLLVYMADDVDHTIQEFTPAGKQLIVSGAPDGPETRYQNQTNDK